MNENLYERTIYHTGMSVFTGGKEVSGEIDVDRMPVQIPLIKAFLEDDDIQEITITSGSVGFVRTYAKRFKKQGKGNNVENH